MWQATIYWTLDGSQALPVLNNSLYSVFEGHSVCCQQSQHTSVSVFVLKFRPYTQSVGSLEPLARVSLCLSVGLLQHWANLAALHNRHVVFDLASEPVSAAGQLHVYTQLRTYVQDSIAACADIVQSFREVRLFVSSAWPWIVCSAGWLNNNKAVPFLLLFNQRVYSQ